MRYRSLFAAGLALALMGAGCMSAPAPEPQAPATPPATPPAATAPITPPSGTVVKPKTVTVEMKDNVFSPQIIAINPGDTVVWKNTGKNNHTSTGIGSPLLWDSGNVAPGKSYSRKFDSEGSYQYNCSIHSDMKGTVVVGTTHPAP